MPATLLTYKISVMGGRRVEADLRYHLLLYTRSKDDSINFIIINFI